MIEIQNLSKSYSSGVYALRHINMNIGTGMFGLLGPNGAGKTTLMRILAGLLTPTEGRVTVLGHDLSTAAGKQASKAMLGYLPQELALYPSLSAREFLDYIAILKGVTNRHARRAQIDELLDLVRLSDKANQKLKTYSGGMKRRIGIAQAMLGDPKLLIVDEPTVGLDPEERVRFRNLLSEMAQRCTVILSTHVIEDISHSCNDLAIMNKGGVLFRGAPSELIRQARGHVWSVMMRAEALDDSLNIVSTLQLQDGVQYRVIGQPAAHYKATALEPGLEDGYIWMMRQHAAQEV